jgi:hypothetical protein
MPIKYRDNECYTPKWIFDKLQIEFDLDVASSDSPYVQVPTKHKYTLADDALVQPWFGRVWMNPPFSKVTPWIDKWIDHNNGLCLVSLASNGKWINKLWDSDAACLYLPSNISFIGASGLEVKMRWRSAIFALGSDNIAALRNLGKVKL